MTKRMLLLAVVVVTLAASMLMTSCGSKPEYNPMKYVTLDVKYFDGEGVAEPVVTPPPTTDTQSSKVIELLKVTTFNYSPDNKLSNGDVVTVVPVCDEDKIKKQGFKPVLEAVQFTVEGLPEGVEVDLWEWWYSNATFEGVDGSGKMKNKGFAPMPEDEALRDYTVEYVKYNIDKFENLSNGDTVTVTAIHDAEAARKAGYKIISETTKTFTVEGLE